MNDKYLLIVEDDVDIRMVLEDTMKDEGYSVVTAQDGMEALKLLRQNSQLPSVILLDLMMPNMNGFQFRQKQLEDDKLSQVPVILFSADTDSFIKAKEFDLEHCLKKPIDLDALFELIKKLWSN